MKQISRLLMGGAILCGLWSCSSDNTPDQPNAGSTVDKETTSYLAVNLVSTPNGGTRAEGDQNYKGDPSGYDIYEEGYTNENAVKNVRFYFFDYKGDAANVKMNASGTRVNYFDCKPDDDGVNMPNIEKKLTANIVINTKEGDQLPSQMVAVLNPEAVTGLGTSGVTLSALEAIMQDFTDIDAEKGFAMCNSVYATGSTKAFAIQLAQSDFKDSETEAIGSPKNVYLEREVAKVRVTLGSEVTGATGNITLGDNTLILLNETPKEGETKLKPIMVDGKKVYLKTKGWNVAAYTTSTSFVKDIDPAWTDDALGFTWNWDPYFRCYWTKNAKANDGSAVIPTWTKTWDNLTVGFNTGKGDNTNIVYLNENVQTGTPAITQATKVVIGGTLVDDKGTAITLYRWFGTDYMSLTDLKKAMLTQLRADGNMVYSVSNGNDNTKYGEISESDVDIVTAMSLDSSLATEEKTGRYEVVLVLSISGLSKTWTSSNAEDQPTDASKTSDQVKALLAGLGNAKAWESGQTYYYFPIKHLGTKGKIGEYGIVRNHIYDCTIDAIYGLGTPVYDPSEVIYPEQPEDNYKYLAAKINILSWRVVPSSYELKW